jgi:hypothetical protein
LRVDELYECSEGEGVLRSKTQLDVRLVEPSVQSVVYLALLSAPNCVRRHSRENGASRLAQVVGLFRRKSPLRAECGWMCGRFTDCALTLCSSKSATKDVYGHTRLSEDEEMCSVRMQSTLYM